jgi:hypothetical protein
MRDSSWEREQNTSEQTCCGALKMVRWKTGFNGHCCNSIIGTLRRIAKQTDATRRYLCVILARGEKSNRHLCGKEGDSSAASKARSIN